MKKLIILLIVALSFSFAQAQSKWSVRDTLPDSTREYAMGFAIGNYGYIGLGEGYDNTSGIDYFNDFWRFDPSTDSWTRMTDFPGLARVSPITFVIGNCAYVVMGDQNTYGYNMTTECWQYNSLTNHWIKKNDFPGLSRSSGVGFAIGNKGYMATGYDTLPYHFLKDVWQYDTASDHWTQKNNFGGAPRYVGSSFAVGIKAYICFGDTESSQDPVNDMWEYDTTTDSWSQKTSCPDSLGYTSGFVINNNIYVGTGTNGQGGFSNHFWMYNTTNDTWVKQANFLGGNEADCSAFSIGDTGYLGMGQNILNPILSGSNTFFRFEPDTTTGINELNSQENTISVYPNPSNGRFTIEFSAINSPSSVEIYNVLGERIYFSSLSQTPLSIINISNQPSGIYLLSIKFNNQTINKKLLLTN